MKNPSSSACMAGLRFTGILLFSVGLGACQVGAETFHRGGSTAIIEQDGGNGMSSTQVIPYDDGQKIITRDGNSTDITIQRSLSSTPSDSSKEQPQSGEDRFDRKSMEERFSGRVPGKRSSSTCSGCGALNTSKEYKERMLDRMGSRFSQ